MPRRCRRITGRVTNRASRKKVRDDHSVPTAEGAAAAFNGLTAVVQRRVTSRVVARGAGRLAASQQRSPGAHRNAPARGARAYWVRRETAQGHDDRADWRRVMRKRGAVAVNKTAVMADCVNRLSAQQRA